jgi:hypothetical protein
MPFVRLRSSFVVVLVFVVVCSGNVDGKHKSDEEAKKKQKE